MSQKYAILGLLNISPMTGYMIKKNLELSIKKFYAASFGGLYPALHKLTEEHLVRYEEQNDSRSQKLYYITTQGKEAFQKWMKNKKNSIQTKDEYMLKLMLSKDLSSKERVELLEDYLYEKRKQLHDIESILNEMDKDELYIDRGINIVTKYSLLTLKQEISILETLIKEEQND